MVGIYGLGLAPRKRGKLLYDQRRKKNMRKCFHYRMKGLLIKCRYFSNETLGI